MLTMTDEPKVPPRVQINTKLTAQRVNSYWRVLNMSKRTWFNNFSAAQRYELVLSDLLDKLEEADGILSALDYADDEDE